MQKNEIRIIEVQWLNFINSLFDGLDRESNQYKTMKMVFYAAYASSYSLLTANIKNIKTHHLLKRLKDEISSFNDSLL